MCFQRSLNPRWVSERFHSTLSSQQFAQLSAYSESWCFVFSSVFGFSNNSSRSLWKARDFPTFLVLLVVKQKGYTSSLKYCSAEPPYRKTSSGAKTVEMMSPAEGKICMEVREIWMVQAKRRITSSTMAQ